MTNTIESANIYALCPMHRCKRRVGPYYNAAEARKAIAVHYN